MWYLKGINRFLTGDIDFINDDINVALIDRTLYDPNYSTDEFLSSVAEAALVKVGTLSGKSAVNGMADASDLVLSAVTGNQTTAILIYKDTGARATSPLILLITDNVSFIPNGGNLTLQWPSTGIFKLHQQA